MIRHWLKLISVFSMKVTNLKKSLSHYFLEILSINEAFSKMNSPITWKKKRKEVRKKEEEGRKNGGRREEVKKKDISGRERHNIMLYIMSMRDGETQSTTLMTLLSRKTFDFYTVIILQTIFEVDDWTRYLTDSSASKCNSKIILVIVIYYSNMGSF